VSKGSANDCAKSVGVWTDGKTFPDGRVRMQPDYKAVSRAHDFVIAHRGTSRQNVTRTPTSTRRGAAAAVGRPKKGEVTTPENTDGFVRFSALKTCA
jgi:hypothetical protein